MRRVLFTVGGFPVYGYGLMIAIGIIAAFSLAERLAKKRGLDADAMFNMGLAGIIAGLIGAKLLYILVELPTFLADPSLLLDIGNGFVVYGGLITGILAGWLYARKKHLPVWEYLDCAACGIALGQGFGRIGCFLAGCCYGRESAWGIHFPADSLAPSGVSLLPTQLISSAGDFLLSLLLIVLLGKRKTPGIVVSGYLLLYAAGRFAVEFLRADPRGSIGVLSTSQVIAIAMALIGLLLALRFRAKKPAATKPVGTK